MKKRIFSILFALVLALTLGLVTAGPVSAIDGTVPDRDTAITLTADRLVDLQSTTDYGWDWIVTELSAHSANPSAFNMYGVVILGLLDAYEETGTESYLDAATGMANHMTQGDASQGEFHKNGVEKEYAGAYDYQFLMRYAEVSDDSTYSDYAIALWAWNKANTPMYATPEALNDELLGWAGSDPGAAAWQLAAFGEASRLMGDEEFATGCADLIVADLDPDTGQAYLVGDHMALAECLEFLNELDPVTYSSTIDDITTDLVAAQDEAGCWLGGFAGTFQDTVYTVRALAVYGGTDGLDAARKGAAWLIANQLPNGGWIDDSGGDPDEFSEQDAEALRALVATAAPITIGDDGYYSIQSAIDSATAGDTISVAAGTYAATTENSIALSEGLGYCFVHIDKPIILAGESRDGVILDGTALQGEVRCTGIWVSVSNVTVKNLTIQNFTQTPLTNACYGLYVMEKFRHYVWDEVVALDQVTAENIRATGNCYPLYFMKTIHATVKDCISENNLSDGIWVAWGSDHATVQGNTVTNAGDHGIWVGQSWMGQGHSSNSATIINNTVNGTREAGISFVASDGAIISGNTITNAAAEHPSVGGWSVGALSLKDSPSNVEAFFNNIYNNDGSWGGHNGTGHGVGIDGTPSNINLYFNNIYGNTGDGCHNYSTVAINATNNWWGNASGPEQATTNPDAIGDEVSVKVTYSPWLGATFDTSPMTFIVDDVGPEPAAGYIQEAIDNASSGDTVNVAAGTYTESVLIAKPLTLRGPNAGISPNPPGSRVAEAVITGVSPLVRLPDGADVNPLTIEGFTFSVLDATAEPVGGSHDGSVILADGASDGWGEVTILSNRFIENYGPAIGVWTSLSEAVNPADWRITDNLIDGVRGTDRSGIYLDLVTDPATGFSGWEISNNTIKNTEYGGIMVHGAVDVVISGNTIEDVRKTGIQSSGVYGNVTITDNVITRAMLDHEPGAFRAGIRIYGTDLGDEYGPSQLIGPVWVTNNIVTDSYIGFATKLGHDFTAHEVHVNGNSFTGNSEAGLRHNGTGLLDATNNWWGNAIESQIAKLVSGNVDYSPWLDAAYPDGKSTSLDVTTISLASGWNLISLPLIPDDSAIETVLAGVTVNKVAYYTGGPEGSWLYYTGDLATSDLTQMQDGKGYWIDASTAGALTIRGYELCAPPPAVPPSYNLVEGWNLISFKSLATNTDVATYLGTAVTDAIEAMYGYDAAAGLYTIIKSTDTLVPGDGYWLAVSAEGTIYP